MEIDFVIKLGGSAITNKSQFETVNQENIKAATGIIQYLREAGKTAVIVHGAGSFGHHTAKEYGVSGGFNEHSDSERVERVKKGFCITRTSVCKLNAAVTEQLVSAGVPAVAVPPFPVWRTAERRVVQHGVGHVTSCLHQALVPVMHGDCVFDDVTGCTILSGDAVIKTLCAELSVKKVVFLMDVEGVYDKPPSEAGAALQEELLVRPDATLATHVQSSMAVFDTTGGIAGKLQTGADITSMTEGRTEVTLCGLSDPLLLNYLLGSHPRVGTRLTFCRS